MFSPKSFSTKTFSAKSFKFFGEEPELPPLRGRKKRKNPIFARLIREDDELIAILTGA